MVTTLGLLASVARASGSTLTSDQLAVVTGLATAVRAAAGTAAAHAPSVAQTVAALTAVYANLSATIQAEVAAVLDAVNASPVGTTFAQLDSELQSSFLHSVFSSVLPAGLADTDFVSENQLLYDGYAAAVGAGTLPGELGLGESPDAPGDGALALSGSPLAATVASATQEREATVFAALALIDSPPPSFDSGLLGLATAASPEPAPRPAYQTWKTAF